MTHKDDLYKSYVSSHVGNKIADSRGKYRAWEKLYAAILSAPRDAAILDIGCGDGDFLSWLKSVGFTNLRGIDKSEEQVARASDVPVTCNSLEQYLQNEVEQFDIIIMRDVLEHMTKGDVLGGLKIIFQSLRVNGCVVIQTTNAESPLFGRIRYGDFTHETAFTARSLSQVLRHSGFENIQLSPQRPHAHSIFSFVRSTLWLGIELLLKIYLLIETGSYRGVVTQNIIAIAYKKKLL